MSMLSELELDVLEAIVLGHRRIDKIAEICGIPPLTAEEIVNRLIDKGYLNGGLNPTEKTFYEIKILDSKHTPEFYGENIKYFVRKIIDVLIISMIIFIILLLL